jgi:hypothetical protein
VQMSTASVWRRTQAWGAKLREHSEAERVLANALPEKWEPTSSLSEKSCISLTLDVNFEHG